MPGRILIVDDAAFMRSMLKGIFTDHGFEIAGEAAAGDEAVRLYRELSPDAVTMDIIMPGKNGLQALREIIAFDPGARVVMCSALGQEALIIQAIEAGALDFIVKPFKPALVIDVMRRVLGH
jgi:two-component system chemotaxis response regulator CheY